MNKLQKDSKLARSLKSLDIRKLPLIGKVIFIISFFLIGLAIIFNFINRFSSTKISKLSIWVLFGWFFLIIFSYVIMKVLSFMYQKNHIIMEEEHSIGEKNDLLIDEVEHYD